MSRSITSVEGFFRKLKNDVNPTSDEIIFYRGHSDKNYTLEPSVFRENNLKIEDKILREIISSHPSEFEKDKSTFDQLVRVQHYSLPTRLLDVTWNPLIALFFSVRSNPDKPGQVIWFKIKKHNLRYYDSDVVSCIANLSHLKEEEKNGINFLNYKDIDSFNEQESIDRLIQFIKMEKPHFRPKINPKDIQKVIPVKAKLNNERIISQSGAFLIFGINPSIKNKIINLDSEKIEFETINIDKNNKSKILEELDKLGINESTLFPGIEETAKYIKRKMKS